jgi:hypothetical protein
VTVIAAIRPDDVNFPLLLHVLGAMLLWGGLIGAATALLVGWRRDAGVFARLGFRILLFVAFPAWWLMRIAGQWTESRIGFAEDDEPAWLGIGYITAELGGLLLLISIILTGIGARRLRDPARTTSVLPRIGGVLALLLVVIYTISVWAMSAKPT